MNAQHELDLDRLNREIDKITAERDAALAKCAEMRAILQSAIDDLPMYSHVGPLKEFLARTDCGKGWHSPAEWSELQAKCVQMREALNHIKHYPVHSEPVGGALDMQRIAEEAISSTTPPPVVPVSELEAVLDGAKTIQLTAASIEHAPSAMSICSIAKRMVDQLEQLKGAK